MAVFLRYLSQALWRRDGGGHAPLRERLIVGGVRRRDEVLRRAARYRRGKLRRGTVGDVRETDVADGTAYLRLCRHRGNQQQATGYKKPLRHLRLRVCL